MIEYRRYSIVVKKNNPLYQEIDRVCFLSKNLFNSTLYAERQLIPKTGYYLIEILYNKKIKKVKNKINKKFASIDLGLNNLATVTSNSFNPFIINGKPLKSINQYSNKMIAKYQSLLPSKQYSSNKINFIRYKREMKVNDYLSKSAKYLVNYLVSQSIDVMVIGTNAGWKQNINIGKRNNQNFTSIPFYKLKNKLDYLCEEAGIEIIEQEESYTSKSSFLDNDPIPTYPKPSKISFSGKRACR